MLCSKCGNEITPDKQITIEGKEDICYTCYKLEKKTVCVDFDGVLAVYDGWKGPDHFGAPMPGVGIFLMQLKRRGYEVAIFTTRNRSGIARWLSQHELSEYVSQITSTKIPAVAYIDDRAIVFRGSFTDALTDLDGFCPHWKNIAHHPLYPNMIKCDVCKSYYEINIPHICSGTAK